LGEFGIVGRIMLKWNPAEMTCEDWR
jgi:hypothetical protein